MDAATERRQNQKGSRIKEDGNILAVFYFTFWVGYCKFSLVYFSQKRRKGNEMQKSTVFIVLMIVSAVIASALGEAGNTLALTIGLVGTAVALNFLIFKSFNVSGLSVQAKATLVHMSAFSILISLSMAAGEVEKIFPIFPEFIPRPISLTFSAFSFGVSVLIAVAFYLAYNRKRKALRR